MTMRSSIWTAAILAITTIPVIALGDASLQPNHPANRLDRITVVGLTDGVLTAEASAAASGRVVIKVDQPLVVDTVSGGEARLVAGWDGTLGYSHYGLELSTTGPAKIIVGLRQVPAPTEPVPTTPAVTTSFLADLQHRGSRFPDQTDQFRAWQQAYRAKLAGWLMAGRLPNRVPLEARTLSTEDFPKFTLRKVQYRSQADRTNTLLLSLPKEVTKAPLLLALHGHEAPWRRGRSPKPTVPAMPMISVRTSLNAAGPCSSRRR